VAVGVATYMGNVDHSRAEALKGANKHAVEQALGILMKGETKWRFAWKVGEETAAVKAITEIAKSTENDFDWFDAAMVCHEMTKITAKAA